MNRQQFYALGLAAALSCSMLVNQPQLSFAAGSTKTTTSFSYSSKVVGNTVIITGNSTTATSAKTSTKPSVSKTPASTKPATSSKTTSSATTSAKPKVAPAPPKKPAGSMAKPTAAAKPSTAAKPKPKVLLSATSGFSFFNVKKPAPALVFKPTPKPVAKVITRVITKTTPKVVSPPKKVVVKTPASTSSKSSNAKGEASFTPEQNTATAFPPAVAVSEPVYLSAPASVHYRTGTILGQAAQVRFTPIDSTWSFSDGSSATGLNPQHRFSSVGTYSASVAIRYRISYRLAGKANWINEGAEITLTDQTIVTVSAGQGSSSNAAPELVVERPYLVGDNCIKNPAAFAC